MTASTTFRRGLLVGAASLALLASACGGDNSSSSSPSTTAASATPASTAAATTTASTAAATTAAATTAPTVDIKGKTVTMLGPETASEADGLTAAFASWQQKTGAKLEYSGTRDAETQIRTAAEAGGSALPDIFMAPQPGLVKDLATKISPVSATVASTVKENFDPYLVGLATINGKLLGVPAKADLKSLVWYSPSVFKSKGYAVPTTWAELTALADKMKADGISPWCIGIESGEATGWPLTDWMEDLMLRMHGPDVYDKWVGHQIPFNDPMVKDVADTVGQIWFGDGNVLGGRESIVSTGFATAGNPILDGTCGMHRQGNFYGANFLTAKPDVKFGADGDVNVFYLPTINSSFGNVTLTGGIYAVAFNDKPETQSAMAFLASADFANARAKAQQSGFLSPNKKIDVNSYGNPLDKQLASILLKASPVRFDGSDAMPASVGAGTFWKEGTNWVSGAEDTDTFLNNVEASWPKQ
jgi:alpha-glucoside transport system substrate-binding protein